jgi:hypothetical protein
MCGYMYLIIIGLIGPRYTLDNYNDSLHNISEGELGESLTIFKFGEVCRTL